MTPDNRVRRPFTGRHMAAILVAGFGVVIAVNLVMATLASTTFGGEVVENSYVASQQFNGWLRKAQAARELGWRVEAMRRADGRVVVETAGTPPGASVSADARHPLGRLPDMMLSFERMSDGTYVSREALPPTRWDLRLTITAAGRTWRGDQAIG
jgi:nitrogen fixation protein FixH